MSKIDNKINEELKQIKLENKKTDLKKMAFIQEIKNGLGEEIRKNPNKVIINKKKKNKLIDLLNKFKNIFI